VEDNEDVAGREAITAVAAEGRPLVDEGNLPPPVAPPSQPSARPTPTLLSQAHALARSLAAPQPPIPVHFTAGALSPSGEGLAGVRVEVLRVGAAATRGLPEVTRGRVKTAEDAAGRVEEEVRVARERRRREADTRGLNPASFADPPYSSPHPRRFHFHPHPRPFLNPLTRHPRRPTTFPLSTHARGITTRSRYKM
jgi:hypothetical protein